MLVTCSAQYMWIAHHKTWHKIIFPIWSQEEMRVTEDEMFEWNHLCNGLEFEQTPEDGEGQGRLMCCSPWGCKESDTTERLNKNNCTYAESRFCIWYMYIVLILLLWSQHGHLEVGPLLAWNLRRLVRGQATNTHLGLMKACPPAGATTTSTSTHPLYHHWCELSDREVKSGQMLRWLSPTQECQKVLEHSD